MKLPVLLATLFASSAATLPAQEAERTDAIFDSLVSAVQAEDPDVDFTALRLSYSSSSHYAPYAPPDDLEDSIFVALDAEEYAKALRFAHALIDSVFVFPNAHMGAFIAYDALGETAKAEYHAYVVGGLLSSVADSGSGQSPEDPIVVIAVWEEYALLRAWGLQTKEQGLIDCGSGKCDVMTITDPDGGSDVLLYFDVTTPHSWLKAQLPAELFDPIPGSALARDSVACPNGSSNSPGMTISATYPTGIQNLAGMVLEALRETGYTIRDSTFSQTVEISSAPKFTWPEGAEDEDWHGEEHPGVEVLIQLSPVAAGDSTRFKVSSRILCEVTGPDSDSDVESIVALMATLEVAAKVSEALDSE